MAIVQFYIAVSKDEDPSEITNNLRYELPDDHNLSADDDLDSCYGLTTNILACLKLSVSLTQYFQQIRWGEYD